MYNKNVIIINGNGGSGKDHLIKSLPEQDKIFNFSSIDIYKEIAEDLGWTGKKGRIDRQFLSDLKALSIRYNDFSLMDCIEAVRWFMRESNAELMFINMREPSEITKLVLFLKKISDVKISTLLITCNENSVDWNNSSDNEVDEYDYDFQFENLKMKSDEKRFRDFVFYDMRTFKK